MVHLIFLKDFYYLQINSVFFFSVVENKFKKTNRMPDFTDYPAIPTSFFRSWFLNRCFINYEKCTISA